jgi:hypothetical protein
MEGVMIKDKAKARWFQYQLKSRRKKLKYCTLAEFQEFYKTKHVCSYCGIPEGKIKKAYPDIRIKAMTVDRKDPKRGYEIGNICWSCFPCNMIKSFFLSYEEMKKIGKKFLRKNWE